MSDYPDSEVDKNESLLSPIGIRTPKVHDPGDTIN